MGNWGKGIGDKKKMRQSLYLAGASKLCVSSWTHVQKMAVLPRTEGGVLGPLMSEGHQLDTHDCPVGRVSGPN